jgi:hypothetical protein
VFGVLGVLSVLGVLRLLIVVMLSIIIFKNFDFDGVNNRLCRHNDLLNLCVASVNVS